MRLLGFLRKVLDPHGPIGAVVSPSIVYKERLGLPTQSPHVARMIAQAPAHLEAALAAPRFVSLEDAKGQVPADRVRQVSAFVEEHWAPVYATTDSTDLCAILVASQKQVGWQVTQRQSRASRARHHSAEDFKEVLQTAQIQASDGFYDGYYETVPGNDPLVIGGEVIKDAKGNPIRGGTMIRGRTEYERKTKGMVQWDVGYVKQREAYLAEMDSRPRRNAPAVLERLAGEVLPMHRKALNPRFDRRSAC